MGSGENSIREQLKSVWRQTGIKPKELDNLVDLPESMVFVWKYFIELSNSRTSSGFGINPISYADMHGYFSLIGYQPEEWEINTIKKLDSIMLDEFHKTQEKNNKKSKSKK